MKVIWLWVIIAVFFTIGALRFVFTGHLPAQVEPQRILNASTFEQPEQIGAVVFRRYWQELNSENLIILASSPVLRDYDRVWRGFIAVANEMNLHFDKVYELEGLRKIDKASTSLDWQELNRDLVKGSKVLVHTVATDQQISEIRKMHPQALFIVQNIYPLSSERQSFVNANCVELQVADASSNESAGASAGVEAQVNERAIESAKGNARENFYCLAQNVVGRGKKKKYDVNKYVVVVEKYEINSHMIYIHEPTVLP